MGELGETVRFGKVTLHRRVARTGQRTLPAAWSGEDASGEWSVLLRQDGPRHWVASVQNFNFCDLVETGVGSTPDEALTALASRLAELGLSMRVSAVAALRAVRRWSWRKK